MLEKLNWFQLTRLIKLVLLMWKLMEYAVEEKSYFKILGLTFSAKLDWGSYIISIAKTASNKFGTIIHLIKFVSPEVALYLYKSNIQPYGILLSCLGWGSYLLIYKNDYAGLLGPSLSTSLEPLAHHPNVVRWSLF